MQDQYKKMFRWIFGGGLLAILLVIPEMLIANSISNNNPEVLKLYAIAMILITMFIYVIISIIKIVKYQKFAKNYKQEELEKISKELTKEFKPVLLNYSD